MVIDGHYDKLDNPLKNAPHTQSHICSDNWTHLYPREEGWCPLPWVRKDKMWPTTGRVDNVFGDKNLVCSCPPLDSY